MKKIPIYFILFFAFACKNNTNNANTLRGSIIKDSIELVKKESIIFDSIARKIKIDSIIIADGDKAIGNIKFGISKKDFNKQTNIFENNLKDSGGKSRIGDFVFKIYKSNAWSDHMGIFDNSKYGHATLFKNDSLFHIVISGEYFYTYMNGKYENGYVNTEINNSIKSVFNLFKSKYGKPHENYFSINEEWRKKQNNTRTSIAKWIIGNKEIYLYASKFKSDGRDGDYVQPMITITNIEIVEKINNTISKEKEVKELQNKRQKEIDDKKNAEVLRNL